MAVCDVELEAVLEGGELLFEERLELAEAELVVEEELGGLFVLGVDEDGDGLR